MDTQTNSETLLEKAEHEGEKIIHAAEHFAEEIIHDVENLFEHDHSDAGPTPTSDGTAQPDALAVDEGQEPGPMEAHGQADAAATPVPPAEQPSAAVMAAALPPADDHGLVDPQGNVASVESASVPAADPNAAPAPLVATVGFAEPVAGAEQPVG